MVTGRETIRTLVGEMPELRHLAWGRRVHQALGATNGSCARTRQVKAETPGEHRPGHPEADEEPDDAHEDDHSDNLSTHPFRSFRAEAVEVERRTC